MIEFFEFLNGCSPERTIAYLIFITVLMNITFVGVANIIKRLRGDVNNHFYYYNDKFMGEEIKEEKTDEDNG